MRHGQLTRTRSITTRIVNAMHALWGSPPRGFVTAYDPQLDSMRPMVTRAITFKTILSRITSAKNGNLVAALDLFAEMEETDARLASALRTRRLAVCGLDFEIVSASDLHDDVVDKQLADDAAQYVRETLDSLDGWHPALRYLSRAIGPNLSVIEIVWEMGVPVAVHPVRRNRLTQNLSLTEDVRIVTREQPLGLVADSPKYIVHIPDGHSGTLIEESLSRSLTMIWLVRKLAIADWATFAELFGMPIRIGRYEASATTEEKQILKDAIKNMGTSAWAMFSRAAEVELVESSQRGTSPFDALSAFCSREMAIAVLGGNLTSDTSGGTGTFSAASVQDQVRDDIRDDDIRREGETIRDQLIDPMVSLRFPGRDIPMPIFRRIKPETIDRTQEATALAAAQKLGIDLPRDWTLNRLGIPKLKDGEAILTPPDGFADALMEGNPNAAA